MSHHYSNLKSDNLDNLSLMYHHFNNDVRMISFGNNNVNSLRNFQSILRYDKLLVTISVCKQFLKDRK